MTWKQFVEEGARKGHTVSAIKKEVPVGSGRWMLLGFEYGKRSRKYHQKFMLKSPQFLKEGAFNGQVVFLADQNTKNVSGPLTPVGGSTAKLAAVNPDAPDRVLDAIEDAAD